MKSCVLLFRKLSWLGLALSAFCILTVGSVPMQAQSDSIQDAPATVPGMLPAFISAGYIDPNGKVPTINAVPGSGIENLDISFPVTVLNHGTNYVYSVVVQDNNYSGKCTVAYKLTQVQNGKTVTLDSLTITSFTTAPGNVWLWVATGKAIPNSPGIATLTGILTYGGTTTTTKTSVLLQ
jgi:hypothetical protein